jgi:hypothetical protein
MLTVQGRTAPRWGAEMNAGFVTAPYEQGFAVKELQGQTAILRMVPELGGRIISLTSIKTGREWCWHQPRPDWLWANDAGDPFDASPQAGIDECVPSVAACQVKGRRIPDHGEVWYQDWSLDPEALAARELRAVMPLTVSPFVFSRTIRVGEDGTFVFDYSLHNTGTEPEPYLWCIHPLLNLEPGDRLELPTEVRRLRLNGGLGAPMAQGDYWDYPEPMPGIHLDRCEVPGMPGGCLKGFAGPLETGRAAVVNDHTGDRFQFSWDARSLPFLGLWINRGHAGFHHVALEPATGAPDSLADALDGWKQGSFLPPRETVRWSLTMDIS